MTITFVVRSDTPLLLGSISTPANSNPKKDGGHNANPVVNLVNPLPTMSIKICRQILLGTGRGMRGWWEGLGSVENDHKLRVLPKLGYCRALIMLMNSGLSEAPPTRKPSTSGCRASSAQFSAVTEPTTTHQEISK